MPVSYSKMLVTTAAGYVLLMKFDDPRHAEGAVIDGGTGLADLAYLGVKLYSLRRWSMTCGNFQPSLMNS